MPIPILNPRGCFEQVEPAERVGLYRETVRRPEELLVLDARHGLTPAQMVDQKLQAMLGSRYRSNFHLQTGRPGTMGRMFGK